MSYCRWGPESDVYAYVTETEDESGNTWWVCHECQLYEGNAAIAPIYAPTLAALRAHLEAHVARGDKVPAYAFERIDKEMKEGIE